VGDGDALYFQVDQREEMNEPLHPSGLTLARWLWPFKTDEERTIVARWFAKQARAERGQGEEALF